MFTPKPNLQIKPQLRNPKSQSFSSMSMLVSAISSTFSSHTPHNAIPILAALISFLGFKFADRLTLFFSRYQQSSSLRPLISQVQRAPLYFFCLFPLQVDFFQDQDSSHKYSDLNLISNCCTAVHVSVTVSTLVGFTHHYPLAPSSLILRTKVRVENIFTKESLITIIIYLLSRNKNRNIVQLGIGNLQ